MSVNEEPSKKRNKFDKDESNNMVVPRETAKTAVFSFGSGFFGELGCGTETTDNVNPKLVEGLPVNSEVVDVKCSSMASFVLLRNGKVYSSGPSEDNGNARQTDNSNESENFYFKQVKTPARIVQIACGTYFLAALDVKGNVWSWGRYEDTSGNLLLKSKNKINDENNSEIFSTKKRCQLPIEKVRKIAAGDNHLVLLTKKNQVYTLGSCECGQLGRIIKANAEKRGGRNGIVKLMTPHVATANKSAKTVDIYASANNTSIKDSKGYIYSCGMNLYSQLALNTTIDKVFGLSKLPDEIMSCFDSEIVDISYGLKHSAFLTAKGSVYTCGYWNSAVLGYDLGENNDEIPSQKLPKKVKFEEGDTVKIKKIMCGSYFTLALSVNGICYVWGFNYYGFCNPDVDELRNPTKFQLGNSAIKNTHNLSSGPSFGLLISEYTEKNESAD
ncbi:MAG: Regulator of chromosome condensation [Paramarteilia canceri]